MRLLIALCLVILIVCIFYFPLEGFEVMTRESAIKAQALVNNYGKLILEAWKDENINDLAQLDYIALIDFEEFEKNQAHRIEAGVL